MAKIAWLVPSILEGSGGHRTIFQNVQALIDDGHECDVYLDDPEQLSNDELSEKVFKFFGHNSANYYQGWDIPDKYDLAFATIMYSAKILHDMPIRAKKAYFIQDFESCFNPMGDTFLIGENSYRLNLKPITIGKWLTHKMINDFGSSSSYFDFCADLNVYKPIENTRREKSVCFIYQPEKPRRCAHLGIEALGILKHRMPDVKIYLYGSKSIGNVWFDHTNLKLVSINECNELYNKCQVGLCISSSNPSRIPFEMMASGLPVVDIHRENNLFDMPEEGILLADQTPEAIASSIMYLLENGNERNLRSNYAREYMLNYSLEHGFNQFVESVNKILNNDAVESKAPSILYNKKPFTVPFYNNYFSNSSKKEFVLRDSRCDLSIPGKAKPTISLDIWDTILRRKCHPDEIKLNTSRYLFFKYSIHLNPWFINPYELFQFRQRCEMLIGQKYVESGFDDEYCISEVLYFMINEIFLDPDQLDLDSIVDELIEYELKTETKFTYSDGGIKDFLVKNSSYKEGDPIVCISDFYMGEKELANLLSNHDLPIQPKRIFSSADIRYNKRSGRIFKKLREEHIITDDLIHVGDNFHSDYKTPKNLKINSLHYINKQEEKLRADFNELFKNRSWSFDSYGAKIDLLIKQSQSDKDSKAKLEGRKYSPIFYGFILGVIEEAIKKGVKKVYYFTREGEFFKRIHDEILKCNPLGIEIPESELLHVSRLSTFFPSLREFTPKELMRVWNMYSTQSISALFKTLNLEINGYNDFIGKYGLKNDEPIEYPWKDPRIINLFNDTIFLDKLKHDQHIQRGLIEGYFNQKSIIFESSDPLFVVDIGWRGTIHDNLAYLMPNKNIYGMYFGQFEYLNEQPENAIKLCYGPNVSVESPQVMNIIKHVAPLEMICNSNNGSVKGFEKVKEEYRPIRKTDPIEDQVFEIFTHEFQNGVIDTVSLISEFVEKHAIWSAELKAHMVLLLSRLLKNPSKEFANAFFQLNHNEEFGTGEFADKKSTVPAFIQKTKNLHADNENKIINFLESTTWPEGFMVNHDLSTLLKSYEKWVEKSYTPNESQDKFGIIEKIKRLIKKAIVTLKNEGFLAVFSKTKMKIKNKLK